MINSAHLHLLTNHFPVIGTILVILVIAYGLIRKNKEVIRTALLLSIVVALVTIVAYTSGEGAEDIVEGMDGVNEEYIHEHEDAALYAFYMMEFIGVVGLAGLIIFARAEKFPAWFIAVFMLLLLFNVGIMARTANLGGKIHHPEIEDSGSVMNGDGHDEHEEDDD